MQYYVASEIQVLLPLVRTSTQLTVWENWILIRARHCSEAYEKAVQASREREGPLLEDLPESVELTRRQRDLLGASVEFLGFRDMRQLKSIPEDDVYVTELVVSSGYHPSPELPDRSELLSMLEKDVFRDCGSYAIQAMLASSARWRTELLVVNSESPAAALDKGEEYGRLQAKALSNLTGEEKWRMDGVVWIGTIPDGIKSGSELFCREHNIEEDQARRLAKKRVDLSIFKGRS